MSRILRIILFVILVLLLLLIGFRCSQQPPAGGSANLLDDAKNTAIEATNSASDTANDAMNAAVDAAKSGAELVTDEAAKAMEVAGDAAQSGKDALNEAAATAVDATDAAMNAAKAIGSSSEDSLNPTAHSVIDDSIKTILDWAKSSPSSVSSDDASDDASDEEDTAPSDKPSAAAEKTAPAAAMTAPSVPASSGVGTLNETAYSIIDDAIKTIVTWAQGGGEIADTEATSDAESSEAPAAASAAPAKEATTEVSAESVSTGASIRLEGVTFASGSDQLVGNSQTILDKVAKVLAEKNDSKVEVAGYTDSTGNAAINKNISQMRAAKVKTYLESKGIAAERMTAVGYGQESPIADNATAEGRKANRRVELHVK